MIIKMKNKQPVQYIEETQKDTLQKNPNVQLDLNTHQSEYSPPSTDHSDQIEGAGYKSKH